MSLIPIKPLSQKESAVKRRLRRLTDDDVDARITASRKKCKSKRVIKAILKKAYNRRKDMSGQGGLLLKKRIQHHLSKGRDAGSIAVFENILVSDVQKIIEEIKK